MVALPGGRPVRERFVQQLRGQPGSTPLRVEVAVEMIAGQQHVRALTINVEPQAKPLSAADLAALNLVDVLDAAVQSEALQQTPPTYVHDDAGPVRLHAALLRGISDQIATESTALVGRNLRPTTLDSYRRIVERVILSKAHDCLG
jgi:hypothetical protein